MKRRFLRNIAVFGLCAVMAGVEPVSAMTVDLSDSEKSLFTDDSEDKEIWDEMQNSTAQTGQDMSDGNADFSENIVEGFSEESVSEEDYSLELSQKEVVFDGQYFGSDQDYYLIVKNTGKKSTKALVDTSGLSRFKIMSSYYEDDVQLGVDPQTVLKPGESIRFKVNPTEKYGEYSETAYICTDNGDRYPVIFTMDRYDYSKDKDALTYKKLNFTMFYKSDILPDEKTVTVRNTHPEKVTLTLDSCEGLRLGNPEKTVLEPGETTTFTIQPDYGLTTGNHDFFVTLNMTMPNGKNYEYICKPQVYIDGRTFCGTAPTSDITNLPNGAPKTVQGLHIPSGIMVKSMENYGEFYCDVEWDVENCAYDPSSKQEQTFEVKGRLLLEEGQNPDKLDTGVYVKIQVNAYDPLGKPAIQTWWNRDNYSWIQLYDKVNEAEGYQYVAVKEGISPDKETFSAVTESKDLTATVKYIPKGKNTLYCRAYKTENGKRVYGAWSDGKEITIECKTPKAPVIGKASVKKCDIRVPVRSTEKVSGYDVVLAKNKNGTEPVDYVLTKTGYSGNSKELIITGAPAGTYYLGVHSYFENGNRNKVLSKWSGLVKVTVKNGTIKKAPAIKKVNVSGRNITVKLSRPKGTDGSDWVLAKQYSYSRGEDGTVIYRRLANYAYVQKNKTGTTVTFKNVKPGTYYLAGHAYVKGYKKTTTDWSYVKKITVK